MKLLCPQCLADRSKFCEVKNKYPPKEENPYPLGLITDVICNECNNSWEPNKCVELENERLQPCDVCCHCMEDGKISELEEVDTVYNYNDPGDSHGHGQIEGKALSCNECDYCEVITPEDYEA